MSSAPPSRVSLPHRCCRHQCPGSWPRLWLKVCSRFGTIACSQSASDTADTASCYTSVKPSLFIHCPGVVLYAVTAELVEAHLDVQGVLEDIVADGAVEELFDLSEEGEIHGGRLIRLVKDLPRLASNLVKVQVLYI